jgi:hypothetical protein
MKHQTILGLLSAFGVVSVAWLALAGSASATPAISPFPNPAGFEIFTSGPATFDPMTHVVSYSGPIEAVQFPGEILSFTDPLVLFGTLTETETFTGTAITPLSMLDTTGQIINLTLTITVGNQVVFSHEDGPLTFSGIYSTPNLVIAQWSGKVVPGSMMIDNSTLHSPWLADFPGDIVGVNGTYDYIKGDGLVLVDSGYNPEPSSIALFATGVAGLAGVLRRKLML